MKTMHDLCYIIVMNMQLFKQAYSENHKTS